MISLGDDDAGDDTVVLHLSMSCEIFWKYECWVTIDRREFFPKYTNATEDQLLKKLSQFLCLQIKLYIHDDLILTGRTLLLFTLDSLFTHAHIHGLSSQQILYTLPIHTIFICTHLPI